MEPNVEGKNKYKEWKEESKDYSEGLKEGDLKEVSNKRGLKGEQAIKRKDVKEKVKN